MKYITEIIFAICVALGSQYVYAGGETKEVCELVKDKKTNKEVKVCKQVKVHKKLEGTDIPVKK